MGHLSCTHQTDFAGLQKLREPRRDIVAENVAGDGRFTLAEGPFDHYERQLTVTEVSGDAYKVQEEFDYKLAVPFWKWLFAFPLRRLLRKPPTDGFPWWAPPDRFDARASRIIALLCCLAVVAAYLGTLLSQTVGLAADEFGASNSDQGDALAFTRIGVGISLGITFLADRRGRRPMLILAAIIGCCLTVATAAAPNLFGYAAAQTISRGAATALALLIGVVAAEETPANSRAYVVSVLALCGGLGAGMVVWFLPLGDLGVSAWRLLFLVPILGLIAVLAIARVLPETARFLDAQGSIRHKISKPRLILLSAVALLTQVFSAPASNFLNDYLREDRGFSNSEITLFLLTTGTPIFIGVLVGGHLADSRGRRITGATAFLIGGALTALRFNVAGPALWFATGASTIIGAAAIPALGVYSFELFGTTRRAESNGLLAVAGVIGSSAGLFLVGRMSDRIGFGPTFGYLFASVIVVAVLIVAFFPETAGKELEEINPEDKR